MNLLNLEKEMMEAGVHFGHQAKKWNPKMASFIFTECKGIQIINLTQTAQFLSEACDIVSNASSKGKQFLILGYIFYFLIVTIIKSTY